MWTEEYSVGVGELDDQHRHLFSLTEKLFAKVDDHDVNPDLDGISQMLSALMDYSLYHIGAEEEYMSKFECVNEAHFAQHRHYRAVADAMLAKALAHIESGTVPRDFFRDTITFIGQWHAEHIIHMDKTYTKCFNDNGLKEGSA